MSKDYYKILGIEKNASKEEIKKAFRKMAHKHHPDKGNGDEAKFKEANEAYQVLSDDKKRQQYDQFGSSFDQSGFQGGQNPFSGFDFSQGFQGNAGFSDIDIDEIFGDFFGGFRRGGRAQSNKGRDLEIEMIVDFKDAALGANRKIKLNKNASCDTCSGSGAKKGSSEDTCSICKGSGKQTHIRQTFMGAIQTQTVCENCQGEGKIIKEKCNKCSGNGILKKEVEVNVDIPGGVDNGQRLRMAGFGEAGKRGKQAGDLFIYIKVALDKNFKREGETIFSDKRIPFSLASLGGKTDVEIIDGVVSLKIPAGTPSGEQFRLRNKGAKRLGGVRRGDHVVTISVDVPKKPTSKQKSLIKDLEKQGL